MKYVEKKFGQRNPGRRADSISPPHQLDAPKFRSLFQANSRASPPAGALLFFCSPLYSLPSPALAQRPSPEARKASLPTLPEGG